MNRNKPLSLMLVISACFCVCLLASALVFTVVLIHWHLDRDFYSGVPIELIGQRALLKFTRIETSSIGMTVNARPATLNNISYFSLYLLYSQMMVIIFLTLVATREYMKMIRSVKQVRVFISQNINSLKKIGSQLLLIFLLSGFQISAYQDSTMYGVYIHLSPLVIAMVCYALSEVFKQGYELMEETRGTI